MPRLKMAECLKLAQRLRPSSGRMVAIRKLPINGLGVLEPDFWGVSAAGLEARLGHLVRDQGAGQFKSSLPDHSIEFSLNPLEALVRNCQCRAK